MLLFFVLFFLLFPSLAVTPNSILYYECSSNRYVRLSSILNPTLYDDQKREFCNSDNFPLYEAKLIVDKLYT